MNDFFCRWHICISLVGKYPKYLLIKIFISINKYYLIFIDKIVTHFFFNFVSRKKKSHHLKWITTFLSFLPPSWILMTHNHGRINRRTAQLLHISRRFFHLYTLCVPAHTNLDLDPMSICFYVRPAFIQPVLVQSFSSNPVFVHLVFVQLFFVQTLSWPKTNNTVF